MDIAAHIVKQSKVAGGMTNYSAQTGISRPHLYKLMNGEFMPKFEQLAKLGLKVVRDRKKIGAKA